jgi:hypothetical protein
MNTSFGETLIDVWRQALVENADEVALGTKRYPVRLTPKRRLRQVDFVFDGNEIRGLEQNPDTKSRCGLRLKVSDLSSNAAGRCFPQAQQEIPLALCRGVPVPV